MRKYRCLALKPIGYDSESHWSLGNGGTAGGPFPATSRLGFTGFFFPLLKPVLEMGGQPTIRQQGLQGRRVTWGNGRES